MALRIDIDSADYDALLKRSEGYDKQSEELARLREENERATALAQQWRELANAAQEQLELNRERLEAERDAAKASHEAQQRNTLAFMSERDEAVALLEDERERLKQFCIRVLQPCLVDHSQHLAGLRDRARQLIDQQKHQP